MVNISSSDKVTPIQEEEYNKFSEKVINVKISSIRQKTAPFLLFQYRKMLFKPLEECGTILVPKGEGTE